MENKEGEGKRNGLHECETAVLLSHLNATSFGAVGC